MKPTSHTIGRNRRSDVNETGCNGFPVTDFAYQTVTLDRHHGGCASVRGHSFRSISNEYFKNEARQSFVTEAAFFAAMVVTASWPIVQSARAMADLMRAFAGI